MKINLNTNRNFRTAGIVIAAFATLGTAACGGAAELIESQAEAVAPAEQQVADAMEAYNNTDELEEVVTALQSEVDRLQGELSDAQEVSSDTQTQEPSASTPASSSRSDSSAPAEEPMNEEPTYEEPAPAEQPMNEEPTYEEPAPAEEPMNEEPETEELTTIAANPEVEGEDCSSVKDLNRYTLDINGGAEVIANDLANPGDVCDFYNFKVEGLDNSNIKSGVLRFVLSCDDDRFIEANNQGRGGFDWRVGGPDGTKYHCGDSWEQSVSYQSYQRSIAIYVNPAQSEGSANYQLTVVPIPN
ncbi:MAG: hypothetical protein ACPGT1_11215 [Ilumatobacteraceae bacterium]